jgi:peptide/nickel transport system permease protein
VGRTIVDLTVMSLVAASVAFVLLQQAPGTPSELALGDPRMDAVARAAWARGFDADATLMSRWTHFVRAAVGGDFGWSWSQQRPVVAVLADTMPYTAVLTVPALVLAFLAGMWLGSRGALDAVLSPSGTSRRAVPIPVRMIAAVPPAWLALMMAAVFGASLEVLPFQGACNPRDCASLHWAMPSSWWARLPYFVLPVGTLTLVLLPLFTRLQWHAVRDARVRTHVLAAVSRGLPRALVLRRHVLRLTWLPLASAAALAMPLLLGGAVFVERVFAWPGLGSTLLLAVASRDYPLVAAISACLAGAGVVATRVAELVSARLDPRPNGASA